MSENIPDMKKPELKLDLNITSHKQKTTPDAVTPPQPLHLSTETPSVTPGDAPVAPLTATEEPTQDSTSNLTPQENEGLTGLLAELEKTRLEIKTIINSKRIITGTLRKNFETTFNKYDDLHNALINEMMNMVERQEKS